MRRAFLSFQPPSDRRPRSVPACGAARCAPARLRLCPGSRVPAPRFAGAVALTLAVLIAPPTWAQSVGAQRIEITGTAPRPTLDAPAPAASRLGLSIRQTPASLDQASQPLLQERGTDTLADFGRSGLAGLTGALRPGAPGVFSSRGFVENGLGVLFDGIRIGGATLTMRNTDSFNYERIELLRGPASVLHGEGAGAGAINFVRRQPQRGPLRGEALLQIGSSSQLRAAAAVAGSLAADVDAVASAAVQRRDGPADAQSTRLAHAVGGLRWRLSGETSLFVELDHVDSSVDNAYWGTPLVGGQPAPTLARRNYNQASDNLYDDSVTWLRAGGRTRLAGMAYEGQLWHYRAERDWKNFYAFSATNVAGRIQPRAVENLAYEHRMSGTRHTLAFGSEALRTLLGAEWQSTEFDSPRSTSGNRPDFDIQNPQPVSFDAFALPRADARRADVSAKALFLENRWAFAPGWALVSGLRTNRLDASVRRPNANVAFDKDFTYTDARAGLVWDASATLTLYASAASGSEPLESLFIYDPVQQGFDMTGFRAFELGAKGRLGGGVPGEWTLALYQLERSDLPVSDPNQPGGFGTAGRQSSQGLEVSIAVRPLPELLIEANAAMLKAEFDTAVNFVGGVGNVAAGSQPPNVPEQVFNLAARWQFMSAWTLGAQVQRVSDRPANVANTLQLPGYTLADLWLQHELPAWKSDVTLRVKNLGDTLPAVWASSGFGQTNVVYGDPRRLELVWRSRF